MFPLCSIDSQLSFIPHMQWHLIIFYFVANFFLCLSLNLSFHLNNVLHHDGYKFSKPRLQCTYHNYSWRFLRNRNTVLLRPILHVSHPKYIYIFALHEKFPAILEWILSKIGHNNTVFWTIKRWPAKLKRTYADQIEEIDIECKRHTLSDSCFEAENEFHIGKQGERLPMNPLHTSWSGDSILSAVFSLTIKKRVANCQWLRHRSCSLWCRCRDRCSRCPPRHPTFSELFEWGVENLLRESPRNLFSRQ